MELKVPKGNFNSFGKYKYRSCQDILENLKPILAKYSAVLILTDRIVVIGSKFFMKSTACLTIADKEMCVTGYAELAEHKGMSAEQATGTASSYARKYALNGLFLIDETEADPDYQTKQPEAPVKQQEVPIKQSRLISATQYEKLIDRVKSGDAKAIESARMAFNLNEGQLKELKSYFPS